MTREVRVYRRSGTGNLELLATLSPSETEYSDQISAENQLSGDICYQVQAISNNDFMNKVNISESNVFCVNMLGEVFIPNAFTPNNDGLNDIFKPSFAILPMKYTFVVYNRYGAKIFETNNISEGWDGRLSNGAKALEGAYIFYIRLENGAGKVLEKRGNFTVIYP
jgi:gliding motility-associated-like protein